MKLFTLKNIVTQQIIRNYMHRSMVKLPNEKQLIEISQKLNFNCSLEEIKALQNVIGSFLPSFDYVGNKNIAPPTSGQHARAPGFPPSPTENPGNAWSWRCDIHHSSSTDGGFLANKTVAVKDSISVAGMPMMNGSKLLEGYTSEYDATVVSRVLDAGGRILGKSTCEDLCVSGSSFQSYYGPVTLPNDSQREIGGSSSGSGYLVASGQVDLALGGDQGGSIRIPSSFSGIVGLKPTFGLVPYTGCLSMEPGLDHVGPMASNVRDCALLLDAIAGLDTITLDTGIKMGLDHRQLQWDSQLLRDYSKNNSFHVDQLTGDIKKYRIAVIKEGFANEDQDSDDLVKEAIAKLSHHELQVDWVSLPMHNEGHNLLMAIFTEGLLRTAWSDGGQPIGNRGYYNTSLMNASFNGAKAHGQDMSYPTKAILLFSEYLQANYGSQFYAKAVNLSRILRSEYDRILSKYDVVVMPTLPHRACILPKDDATIEEKVHLSFSMIRNTCVFNITGHPSITVNVGQSDGLSVGMMICGRHMEDGKVLNTAFGFEQIR